MFSTDFMPFTACVREIESAIPSLSLIVLSISPHAQAVKGINCPEGENATKGSIPHESFAAWVLFGASKDARGETND